jgi:hypothetical protein
VTTVFFRFDYEPDPYAKKDFLRSDLRRSESFETKAQASRWIKHMKEMSKKHPDEAQFVHLETISR